MLGIFFVTRRWPAQKSMAIFAMPAGMLAYAFGLLGNFLYYDPRPFLVEHFIRSFLIFRTMDPSDPRIYVGLHHPIDMFGIVPPSTNQGRRNDAPSLLLKNQLPGQLAR